MDLLERSSLLDKLGGVLAATAAGGRVVLVAGEAGIGKSVLVKRFAERQAADAWFLLGTCDPLLTPRALGPLHDIARQTGGRLAELLASGGPREAVFAALLDQLAEPPRGQVVVVAFLSTIVDFFVVAFPNHVILARSGVCLSKFRGRCERN